MEIIILFISILLISYCFILIVSTIGFYIKKQNHPTEKETSHFFSIIIAARNEEKAIVKCIESILNQSYRKFEVIIIDDLSEDNTFNILKEYSLKYNNIIVQKINTEKNSGSKKKALIQASNLAKGNYIITTDADCWFGKNWLYTIHKHLITNNYEIVLCPVKMTGKTIFSKFQQVDFLALQGLTIGSCNIGNPIMSNGANLVIKRKIYKKITGEGNLKEDIASGDDMFLLQAAKKLKLSISFLKDIEACAYTETEQSLKDYINQRIRWASKSKYYNDFTAKTVAIIGLLTNIFVLVNLVLAFVNQNFVEFSIAYLLIKFIIDFIFLLLISSFYNEQKNMFYYPLFMILYPINVFVIILFSIVGTYKWKKRTIRT